MQDTLAVRDRCLCLAAQRAARALARRFDLALKPVGLTNGQFSLLNALNQPQPPRLGQIAEFLAMDRTTLTAALKVLERQGMVATVPDEKDRRNRRLMLTVQGHARLAAAIPIWKSAHDQLDSELGTTGGASLRAALWPVAAPILRQSDAV